MKKVITLILLSLFSVWLYAGNGKNPSKAISAFPWVESFEGTTFPPEGWTTETEDASGDGWEQNDGSTYGPGNVPDGAYAAMADVYNISKNMVAKLKTPVLQLGSLSNPKLKLSWQCTDGYSQDPVFVIKMSTDNGANYSEIYNQTADGFANDWVEIDLELTGATDETILSFEVISDYGSKNLFIDHVQVYEPAPMQFVSAESFQNNTNVISIGSTNNDIVGINIKTQGALNKLTINDFNFSLDGTTDLNDITRVQLFYTGNSNSFTTSTPLGETSIIQNAITLNGNTELAEGNNYFWLAFDISAGALLDNLVDASCSQITIGTDNYAVSSPNPDANRQLKKILNMSSGTNTVAVNENLVFYDDGGELEKYSEGFEGTITFIPNTSGKSIKIEWNNFEIFNTSSTGNNDIFKIYHGSTTDEANLIDTYSEMPPSIYSMDASGAITIYFKVNTGVPKEGWQALVSEFTPSNMSYVASNVLQEITNVVSASETDAQILKIEIETENTLNPISTRDFIFNTSGSSDAGDIAKAKLYYTTNKNVFSSSNLVGEQNLPNGEFTISSNQELSVGKNYFWLVYDMANLANHYNVVDASCTSVNVGGASQVPTTTSPEGNRTIDNTYRMPTSGTLTKTIYQEIPFTDDNEGPGGKYSPDAMSTVTFIPSNSNEKMKVDFSSFDIYYSSSTYGTKAVFKIFNGNSTVSADLLWEADETNCSDGPGYIVTSTADNGTLTIQFAGNTYTSTYTKTGWEATLWSEVPKDMEFKSAEVTQQSGFVKPGSIDQQILSINLKTSGTLNPVNNTIFTFNTNGTTQPTDLSAARLYFTGKDNAFSITTPVGTEISAPENDFTFTCTNSLEEGNNYFWLVYDIASGATIDNTVDAELKKVQLMDSEHTVENGAPAENSIIKNIYNLVAGINTVYVNETPLQFFDDGGQANKYSKDFTGTVTFIPEDNTQKARLTINSLQFYSMDEISVYNGTGTEDENLIREMDGDENIINSDEPYVFKSTADNGELTVEFKSYSWSTPKDGWEATVQSFIPQAIFYKDVVVNQANTNPVIKNEKNAEILQVKLNFGGETTPANITNFKFNTGLSSADSDIFNAKLYYSEETNILNIESSELLGETTPDTDGNLIFNCDVSIINEAGFYFWLVYDISKNAKIANLVDATLINFTINDEQHNPDNGNPAGSRKVIAGMQGEFIIDQSGNGDFISFEEAASSLIHSGIEDDVVFLVEDGIYVERVQLPEIQGTSSENTIKFRAKNGVKENVKFVYNLSITSSDDIGIFELQGADFVTFEKITFKTSKTSYDGIILIRNQSRDITFESCYFDAPFCTGYSDISAIDTDAENVANENNDRLTINNCEFNGSATALSLCGTGYVVLPKEKGHIITNNTFRNQGRKVAWLDNQKDIRFENNLILVDNDGISEMIAVVGYRTIGNSVFSNNTIRSLVNKEVVGFQFRYIQGDEDNHAMIYNNVVNLQNAGNESYGFEFDDGSSNTEVYYNTVLITGSSTNNAALRFSGGTSDIPANMIIKNNMFVNKTEQYAVSLNNATFYNEITFDYNNLFTAGTNLCKNGSDMLSNLNNWKTLTGADHSVSEDPVFYSDNDLHLQSAGNLNCGIKIASVLVDMDNEIRSEITPTLGADEFSEPSTNAPVFADGYPFISNIDHQNAFLNVKTDNNGMAYFVILVKDETAPSVDQVINGTDATDNPVNDHLKGEFEFYKNKAASGMITGLNSHTEYDVYMVVKDNLDHIAESVAKVSFQTSYKPTEPSTFELIATTSDNFEDGTAYFSGVNVIEGEGATEYSFKQVQVEATQSATISLTNTDDGLILDGFFIKSASATQLKGIKADASYTEAINLNSYAEWDYVSLRSLGQVVGIEITAGSEIVYIDDFSALPLELSIDPISDITINAGEEAALEANVSGGVKPYNYEWTPAENLSDATVYNPIATPSHTTEYKIKVTDAFGSTTNTNLIVNVLSNEAATATFEELFLSPESYWIGNPEEENSIFYSGSFSFNNYYNESYMTWMGFAYSNETSTDFDPDYYLEQQFRSAAGSGAMNSENYGVAYAYGFVPEINLTNTSNGELLKGTFITNTAYLVSSLKNGDGFIGGPFEQGDWYKVTFSGRDKIGNITSSIDIYLADYRSDNPDDHYILNYWKWVDLSSLGEVQKIYFTVSGSRNNEIGLTIPAYFCIDNFNAIEQDAAPYVRNTPANPVLEEDGDAANIDLSDVFSDCDNDDNDISISIKSNSDVNKISAEINDNILTITPLNSNEEDCQLIIEALSNGKTCELTMQVTINPFDNPPVIANAPANPVMDEDANPVNIDFTSVFTDIDNNDSEITLTVKNISEQTLLNAGFEGKTLTINPAKDQNGTAIIKVEALSNNKTCELDLTVTINPLDDVPVIANAPSNPVMDEDADPVSIDLTDVFTDVDNDDNLISLSVKNISDTTVLSAKLNNKILSIHPEENQYGTSDITIEALSNGKTCTLILPVSVNPIDDAPYIANELDNLTINSLDEIQVDLSNVFSDIDNNDADIEIQITGNSNEGLLLCNLNNNILLLKALKAGNETITIDLKAISNNLDITYSYDVSLDISTGINMPGKENISFYPNPCRDVIFINSNDKLSRISIYSLHGQLIKVIEYPENKIDVTDISSGTYILKLVQGDQIITRKFIKQ